MINDKIILCGIAINNVTLEGVFQEIDKAIKECLSTFIVTPNVDHLVKLQKDTDFKDIYRQAALALADGMPLLWAAKFLKTPLKEKISGSDLFPEVCKLASEKGYRIFLLGGRPPAAEKAAEILKAKYTGLQVAGTYSPPFGFEKDREENDRIISMIKETHPDILFVGLGAPKQEKWIFKYKEMYQVPVSIGVGVSFEFIAGMVKRAPLWMQKGGLEWFWRLIMEPRRLWKRYLVDDIQFFWLVFKQKYFKGSHEKKSKI